MGELQEEFESSLNDINQGKAEFSEDEQNIIDSWVTKLTEKDPSDESFLPIRNEYARTLARLIKEEKQLLPPFNEMPPEEDLVPLSELGGSEKPKLSFQLKKMPCAWPKRAEGPGAVPKTKKASRTPALEPITPVNEHEDVEEMAKVIARSKGQSFTEFVASISRHTSDFGQGLRQAMKTETTLFRDYVDHVLSQRIKDLTEVLDEEQNRELQKIKRDIDNWQLELSHVKRRIKDLAPDFDLEAYKKDKNYLKRMFSFDTTGVPEDDPFKSWKEETCHRLKYISDLTCKVTRCNEQAQKDLACLKSEINELESAEAIKHQNQMKFFNRELCEYQKLKCERDKLQKEYAELFPLTQEYRT